jgi:hypothetical protein
MQLKQKKEWRALAGLHRGLAIRKCGRHADREIGPGSEKKKQLWQASRR